MNTTAVATDIPTETRSAVRERAGGCCEDCGCALPLELHHLRYWLPDEYEGGNVSIRGREAPGDLLALCRDCHENRHVDGSGAWWNDPEEMAAHWESFWEEM